VPAKAASPQLECGEAVYLSTLWRVLLVLIGRRPARSRSGPWTSPVLMAALALLNEPLELRSLFRGQDIEGFLMCPFHRRFDLRAQRLSAGLIFGAELTLIILTQGTQRIVL
jgi:hypothetical protein